MEGAQIPIVASNKSMFITHANDATVKVFGYSLEELVGQKVNILMLPEDSLRHDGYIENFNSTGVKQILSTVGRLVSGRHKNGNELSLRLTTTATSTGYAAVFVDITEQLATERLLATER